MPFNFSGKVRLLAKRMFYSGGVAELIVLVSMVLVVTWIGLLSGTILAAAVLGALAFALIIFREWVLASIAFFILKFGVRKSIELERCMVFYHKMRIRQLLFRGASDEPIKWNMKALAAHRKQVLALSH